MAEQDSTIAECEVKEIQCALDAIIQDVRAEYAGLLDIIASSGGAAPELKAAPEGGSQ